jgi:hypothetical protein
MLHHVATLVLAVDDHEPAKLPFYIGGGALALWAVLLGFSGLRAGDAFPGSVRAERGLIGVSLLLVAVAIATALITS